MPSPRKARLVPLAEAFGAQHPDRDDLGALVAAGSRLRRRPPGHQRRRPRPPGAAIQVRADAPLRGSAKLDAALAGFGIAVDGRIALDAGAAAGGFTATLLAAGAARVYAVDVGHGQLRGSLRQDPRVVVLERTNLADLDTTVVPDADRRRDPRPLLSLARGRGPPARAHRHRPRRRPHRAGEADVRARARRAALGPRRDRAGRRPRRAPPSAPARGRSSPPSSPPSPAPTAPSSTSSTPIALPT